MADLEEPPMDSVEQVMKGLTSPMRAMLARSRREWPNLPPRCYGPANTRRALRERGLAHGDFAYLTPLGLEVRARLLSSSGEG